MKNSNIFRIIICFIVFVLLISGAISASDKHKQAKSSGYQLGHRVVFSEHDEPKPTAIDRHTWKQITLHVSQPVHGSVSKKGKETNEYTIKTLVSPEWFETHKVRVGSMVPLPMDLENLDFGKNQRAKVVGVDPCPEIQNGPGRVIVSLVKHFSKNVYELTSTTPDGATKTIKQDISYRFQSVDRSDWIRIGNLKKHDKIRWHGNMALTVVSVRPLPKADDVYDIALESDNPQHIAAQAVKHVKIPDEVWTPGISGNRLQNARDHWNKHRREFPQLKSEQEYIQYAYDFVHSAPMQKKNSRGDTLYFDPKSGTFAVTDKHGIMRTCFKPDRGLAYYEKQ